MSRQRKDITPPVQKIILTLVRSGDSDRRVTQITGVRPEQWRRLAKEDAAFGTLLEKAIDQRGGGLGRALRNAMFSQIRRGHPWWAKLAIHNYNTGLKDPDVSSGAKLKRIVDRIAAKSKGGDDDAYFEAHTPMEPAALPPGAVPSVEQSGAVQDDPRGTPQRQDGSVREAEAGSVAVGLPGEPPPVA